jgi:phenylpyruvate tautomerase PptA (4-oxalocrotonate tautomerase family)
MPSCLERTEAARYLRRASTARPGTGRRSRLLRSPVKVIGVEPSGDRVSVHVIETGISGEKASVKVISPADTLADLGKASAWLDITITASTNSKDEKATYLEEIFAFLASVLGPLHETSYALIHEVQADAYGYGGRTQEHRYVAAKLAG